MSQYIPASLRMLVAERARHLCEYCLIHKDDSIFSHEIEHIISLKHGGSSLSDNLAYACLYCNRNKGSDLGTLLFPAQDFVRFFNPRIDLWHTHFRLSDGEILPLSRIGEATIKILEINNFERIIERRELILDGRYPR